MAATARIQRRKKPQAGPQPEGEGATRPVLSVELTPELEDAFNLALSEKSRRQKELSPNILQTIMREALTVYFRQAGYI